MFKNYFLVALRHFWRNKMFSTINVLGQSIGISASLVLFLIVYYEFSFDRFEKDGDRIYRVVMEVTHDGDKDYSAAVPAPLGAATQNELTGIAQTVPLFQFQGDATVKVSIKDDASNVTEYKKQEEVIFTNDDYFAMLPYRWIAGAPQTALKDPFSVVLTESRAQLYFPHLAPKDVTGKTVIYGDTLTTTITGIVANLKERSFFTQQEFISLPTIMKTELRRNFMMDVWNDWMAYSQLFIKTTEGISAAKTEAALDGLLAKYNKHQKGQGPDLSFQLQPLKDVHFNYETVGHRTAHKPTLYGLLAVAIFLLLLGCINFVNLSTAQSTQRAKEIGIRKTIGSSRKQLILQFLSETFLITVVATLIAVALTPLLLNMFSGYIPDGLQANFLSQPSVIVFLLVLILLISFFAGIYPAMVLSGFKPVTVLKTQAGSSQPGKLWLRKTLTVSQFVIAQFFVIATLMVSKQISYTLNKDLGFKKDAIINFTLPRDTSATNRFVLLQKINAIPEIQLASMGFLPPASDGPAYTNVSYPGMADENQPQVQIRWGDTNYLKLYHIKLLAGRNILQSDTVKEFIINEAYAKTLGFKTPADAIGKQLIFNQQPKQIVGVMQDFNELSLHAPVEPLVFTSFNRRSNFFHIALKPQNGSGPSWQTTLAKIEKAYKEMYPASDFSYSFFDEAIAKFYAAEQRTSRLLKWATGLAIFISCLGLLGLILYTINVRRKEIGIRKVMGASVTQIVSILSTDYLKLVVIAFAIAAPFAWWAVYNWLQDFSYRTTMSWWLFLLSGCFMLIAAFATLSIETIRAATANPVKSLRTE